jgi:tetratricopeptide (TPR) repeat protein
MYTFEHLSRLRALREMRHKRMSAKSIRRQIDAMHKVSGMRNALVETSVVRSGGRLAFRHGGALVDPLTKQLAFDFATLGARQLQVTRAGGDHGPSNAAAAQEMFVQAVQLEENPATLEDAIAVYGQLLEYDENHAPACINLGTIHYNRRDFKQAEDLYRRATVADPSYALAFFDLGNVLDETQRLDEAIQAYQHAISLVPQYADAHYNLALAFERQGERRRALCHWMTYVRLDPVGQWAAHAKGQARKILAMDKLRIVSRYGRQATA